MDFGVRSVGRMHISDGDHVVVSGKRLAAADFSGRWLLQFSAEGSLFERCRFDDAEIQSASFGAGRTVFEYVGCSFNGAKLSMAPGGYVRFVDCTFERAAIEH